MFSIGYGNRKIEDFISLLQQNNITTLVDIRSKPVSRFQPHYNKVRLSEQLGKYGINYRFMGLELGGKPKDEKYYVDGQLNYSLIVSSPVYQDAISGLITSLKDEVCCMMCCELKPNECHRQTLVGETLYSKGIITNHIDEKGGIVFHSREQAHLTLF